MVHSIAIKADLVLYIVSGSNKKWLSMDVTSDTSWCGAKATTKHGSHVHHGIV